ncbi:MAG TPA: flagellar biosynthetic protein FliR [Bryobacteraceae bacterium]|nr:flagellar biosynthetic protein FliR [Bryobacteraceae bacterium]
MHGSLAIPASLLYGFLLVLARIAGIFSFIPLPGINAGPNAAKITLSLALTFALFPRWPAINNAPVNMLQFTGWVLSEAAIGVAIGLAVALVLEGVIFAAQAISTQAGFSYASTVDPTTNADSTVLIVLAQTTAALVFFVLGLHRQLLLILARSLETHPPGAFSVTRASAEGLVHLGASVFSTGFRLALPLMTLLFLIDLSVGLLGHLNAQLQLIALVFPAKMLVSLAALSFLCLLIPKLFEQSADQAFTAMGRLLGL